MVITSSEAIVADCIVAISGFSFIRRSVQTQEALSSQKTAAFAQKQLNNDSGVRITSFLSISKPIRTFESDGRRLVAICNKKPAIKSAGFLAWKSRNKCDNYYYSK
ncbi:hypothetical protein CD191_08890 [Paenibacillus odorifer]|uniref:Uncharacterized protein n=1 Tax=Paenibacillus odorifer TaxID=189426 RepID=A0A1R0Z1U7_9BACL|nr:hypothetical protein CD191_08890 [Paenibacillus odorifer]OME15521.1 hypothetical protein BSK60_08975 [Paenibacillus odorifer]OME22464.1 hypothetical protein BSK47_05990 [Paenibacillus odorifer]